MIFPTDLSPAEQAWARARLAELAEQFTAKGELRSPRWREVFERTWRHPYVPAFHPDRDTPAVLCFGATRQEWPEAVYSDTTLITKLTPVGLSRALRRAMTAGRSCSGRRRVSTGLHHAAGAVTVAASEADVLRRLVDAPVSRTWLAARRDVAARHDVAGLLDDLLAHDLVIAW